MPQGSVLGPLLFTIYINDISSITSTPPRLFADDTCLIIKDSKFENLNHKIETEVTNVNKWLKANKLSINLSKSNTMILDPKHNLNNKLKTSSAYANSNLGLVSSTKYLGVTIDHCLSFDLHIKNLMNKLSRSVGILAKVKPFLSTAAMLTLYHAIFQSHLQYGVLVWSSTSKSYLKKLIVLQNKALKIIGGAKWNERASPNYLKFKILKLPDIFKFESAVFTFKFNKQLLLSPFSHYFSKSTTSPGARSLELNFFRTNFHGYYRLK